MHSTLMPLHGINQSLPLTLPKRCEAAYYYARRRPLSVHLGFAGGFCQLEVASDGRELNENDRIEYNIVVFLFFALKVSLSEPIRYNQVLNGPQDSGRILVSELIDCPIPRTHRTPGFENLHR